jgi:hypothetical membrane protein
MIISAWFFIYFIALIIFMVISLTICIRKVKGYSILKKEISKLGHVKEKSSRIFNSVYIVFGLSLLLLFYFLFNANFFNFITFLFFFIGGFFVFLAGVFPENFSLVHQIVSGISFVGFATGSVLFFNIILDSGKYLWMIIPSILIIISSAFFLYTCLFYEIRKVRKLELLNNFCFWEWMLVLSILLEIIGMFILLI